MRFLHVRLKVRDLDRSVGFYVTHFGATVRSRHQSGRGSQLAHLRLPESDAELELAYLPWDPDFHLDEDLVHLAFQVDDLAQTLAALRQGGVTITEEAAPMGGGGWMAWVADPDGYEIELLQRITSTGS